MTGPAAMERGRLTGRTVLMIILAFFGVIFAVNGAFVFFALDSWPGLISRHYYDEGIHYNRTLAAAENQAALGWNSRLDWNGRELAVTLTGRDGKPLAGLDVTVKLVRPTSEGHDFTAALTSQADGTYRAAVDFPLPGLWRAEVMAHDPHGPKFLRIHDFMVAP